MEDAPKTPLGDVEEMERMKKRFLDAQNSRELLAVHEAGHAAVAEHLNMGIKRVVVQGLNTSYTETDKRPLSKEMLHNELCSSRDIKRFLKSPERCTLRTSTAA